MGNNLVLLLTFLIALLFGAIPVSDPWWKSAIVWMVGVIVGTFLNSICKGA